jgi:2-epi-5-epi-valiolone 7-kinase
MPEADDERMSAVFDIGGTWFRSGLYSASRGLLGTQRIPAINYLSCPSLSAEDLQIALADFLVSRVRELRQTGECEIRRACISLGAPVNAHDMTVLGSGPLWGPTAKRFRLHERLSDALPDCEWLIVNDVTALLAPYMNDDAGSGRTMLITVSSGIGSRLYDHRTRRIPYDRTYGVQGEIGHLAVCFELEGKIVNRQCECGGWNHINAFSSGRGIAQTLRELPDLTTGFSTIFRETVDAWKLADDACRLRAFQTQIEQGNTGAIRLLDAIITPLSRALAAALSLDPEIDRIVITGGVARGLGEHYQEALRRTFIRDGLYQITEIDPDYLTRRVLWERSDDYSGLRGAGVLAAMPRA